MSSTAGIPKFSHLVVLTLFHRLTWIRVAMEVRDWAGDTEEATGLMRCPRGRVVEVAPGVLWATLTTYRGRIGHPHDIR